MRSVVVGTAGHIDHGKTTLLQALTGIDADRLPEERARGMTIDVGFAHLDLPDGSTLDFVDVPGHDRLVGNMLVGAGEIDAVLLVVAADDGPRAQTIEHLELLDAIGHDLGVVAITKVDAAEPARVAEVTDAVRQVLDRTRLRGSAIVAVSGTSGSGIEELRERLVELRDAVLARDAQRPHGPVRLAIDRAFSVKGRGDVVTGTLRGGPLTAGMTMRSEPGGDAVRIRDVQVRHGRAERAAGGRTGLNVSVSAPRGSSGGAALRRGQVLTAGPGVRASSVWLASLRPPTNLGSAQGGGRQESWPPRAGTSVRLHVGTEQAEATIRPVGPTWASLEGGAVIAVLRLSDGVAALALDRAVLRDPGSSRVIAGVTLLHPGAVRGPSRRRVSEDRLRAISAANGVTSFERALVDLHGALTGEDRDAIRAAFDVVPDSERGLRLAADVEAELRSRAEAAGRERSNGVLAVELRAELLAGLRHMVTIERRAMADAAVAIDGLIDALVASGRIARREGRLLDPARQSDAESALEAAMARLEAALDVDVPPGLADAAAAAGCGPDGIRALESAGRIIRVDDDLAWSRARYDGLRDRAVRMASISPLTPAAFRDAIGGNRRVVMPLLEDLGRKGFLRRTDAGHVPGPRAVVRA
ncbi:MAG TPA: selenocysteine-specific translation elongation factor [Candidatus Limnocylindrales bacterium]|nr:selenocysteine-specific translation elongation factor [Candidatus Limnocylindrales bacterium]